MNKTVCQIAEAVIPQETKKAKVLAVMLFYRASELGIPREVARPNQWINTRNIRFDDTFSAMQYYANTPCPASQLIEAGSMKELESKMNEMISNFGNPDWLRDNLYPYL